MNERAGQSDDGRSGEPGLRELASVAAGFLVFYAVYFSPALWQGRLLAPGDGLVSYVPALLREWSLWVDDAYIGFPAFADIQFLTFSPLRFFGDHYNVAVLSAYVLASSFAYAYARCITGLRIAGALAGVIYGSSGFMVAHLGHLTIIHTAAWLPAILWGLERLSRYDKPADMVLLSIAIAFAFLGGHPQIFVYTGLVAAAYVVFLATSLWSVCRPRAKLFVRKAFIAAVLGVAIVAIQLVPLAELAAYSPRTAMTFGEFTSYALDPRDLLLLFTPNLWGSQSAFWPYYFGHWNLTELACYVGLPTLYLAGVACVGRRRNRYIGFWSATAVAALLYALGSNTPLAALAFHLPGLNLFRAPARMVFVAIFAFAALAAIGLQALLLAPRPLRTLRRATVGLGLIGLLVLIAGWSTYPQIFKMASARGITLPPLYANRAIWIPVVLAVVACVALYAVARWRTRASAFFVLALLAMDLASFGWFYEWRDGPVALELTRNPDWASFARRVRAEYGRLLFVDDAVASAPARPNLNLLYELPVANGYGPLQLKGFGAITGIETNGRWSGFGNAEIVVPLLGIGWVAGGNEKSRINVGGDCGGGLVRTGQRARVPERTRATHVRLVSHLSCSVGVANAAPVLEMTLRVSGVTSTNVAVRAGIDTAEWAIERSDVAKVIAHGSPRKREAFPADGFSGYWFETEIPLSADGGALDVDELILDWKLDAVPTMAIRSLELIDRQTGTRVAVHGADFVFTGVTGWIPRPPLPGVSWLRHNPNASRAWSVAEVRTLPAAASLANLRAGAFDGKRLDLRALALIEPGVDIPTPGSSLVQGKVSIREWTPGRVRLGVEAPAETFVVVSQMYYPGWHAEIDGTPVNLLRTDALLQGLFVPGGTHDVVLYFRSLSLMTGAIISAGALLVLIIMAIVTHRPRQPPSRRNQ
ncbi:MAG: hypothetical protein ACR2HE_07275 [Casimicrobiaceae bacterium]